MNPYVTIRPGRMVAAVALSATLSLAACAPSPTREDNPAAFQSLERARLAPINVQPFADCLLEGFKRAHTAATNFSATLRRRGSSYRVETWAGDGRILAASADVFDTGAAELLVSDAIGAARTAGEREAFRRCAARYGAT